MKIEIWYDRQTRNWVQQMKDDAGNQIGDAVYTHQRPQMPTEFGTVFMEGLRAFAEGVPTVDMNAGDHTPEALEAAGRNYTLLRNEWHNPKKCHALALDAAYYRDPKSGSHGWMCKICCGIVQTG